MSSQKTQSPMNPTVEDAHDESENRSHPNRDRHCTWPELFSQHGSVLASHLRMLKSVNTNLPLDGDGSRIIAALVDKTEEMVRDFQALKDNISSTNEAEFESKSRTPSEVPKSHDHNNDNENTTSRPSNANGSSSINRFRGGRKRSRIESKSTSSEAANTEPIYAEHPPLHKRKRIDSASPEPEQDASSPETEDISAEVQRRLDIKEEQRSKRSSAKPEKRKRESRLSNGSNTSSGEAFRPNKKTKN